ncbi:MAG: hypothetical protein KBG15_07495 [Kofleriaceae bacterium]|nr:hypothetical protein [Kofleriaceae bacterium]
MQKAVATALLLAGVSTMVACVDLNPSYDSNGDGDPNNDNCWSTDCGGSTAYFNFTADQSSLRPHDSRLALGGRSLLTAQSIGPSTTPVAVSVSSRDTSAMMLRQIAGDQDAITVEMRPTREGEARLDANNGTSTQLFWSDVLAVKGVGLVLPHTYYAQPSTKFFVGATTLYATLCPTDCTLAYTEVTGDTRLLVDSSLHLLPASSPALTQSKWDTFTLPSSAGHYAIALQSDSIGTLPFDVEIVDAVDGIGVDVKSSYQGWGQVCFYFKRGEDRVMSGQLFSATPLSAELKLDLGQFANCVRYTGPSETTHAVEVTSAGVTATVTIEIL